MAIANPVARVAATYGQVYAKGQNGTLRSLRVGDVIYENEVIVTGPNSAVDLVTMGGLPFRLGANEVMALDIEVAGSADVTDAAFKITDGEFKRLVAALNEGRPIDELLEETAAGSAGNAGGGSTFVRLLHITEGVSPLSFEFGSDRLGGADGAVYIPRVDEGVTPTILEYGTDRSGGGRHHQYWWRRHGYHHQARTTNARHDR